MEGWLKALIACACVVVIIGGGYMAFDIKQMKEQRTAATEEAAAQSECRQSLLNKDMRAMREYCLKKGYISDDEFYRAGL
ncbi:hypothetical protein EHH54_31800 [Rhizobium leguminosarum]|uniref:hypothetical protein n=1 Tax=Rhizobium leguminosarum TaxID=384 RepID=UPI000FEC48AD|nr:hypothetical protein [Rhizobium leguminosarum]RWX28960.1 hypothetical protein EHH54_31800 [Rhizobium leguminosarum]